MIRYTWTWLVPLLLVVVLTPFLREWDLSLSSLSYSLETGQFTNTAFTKAIFRYGPLPCWIVGVGSLVIALLSLRLPRIRWLRHPCLVIALTAILGSGLIVNGILKPYWGRPRPRQIEEFGGNQQYHAYYQPQFSPPEPSYSFPSGHASTGFFFLSLCTVGWRHRSRLLIVLGIMTTTALAGMLGYTRIVQGGHFLSDVLFAGVVMWMTVLVLDWLIYKEWTRGGIEDERTNKTAA